MIGILLFFKHTCSVVVSSGLLKILLIKFSSCLLFIRWLVLTDCKIIINSLLIFENLLVKAQALIIEG